MINVIYDVIFIGLPCFIAGMLTMVAIFATMKEKQDDKRKETRKKRIRYINYLINLVMKKRREENKIDVD